MAIDRKGSSRWPTRCARLGDVTIVAPMTEASAIGHALTLRRPLRLEAIADRVYARRRHADRLRQHRRHAGLQGPAGSRRLRHQQGMEPRRRCDVFGDGGGRARGGAARGAGDCGVARNRRAASTISATRRGRRRRSREAMLGASAAGADVPQHQRARAERRRGFASPCRRSGITSRRWRSGTIRKGARISGSRKGRTSGSRTTARIIRRCATATCR